MEKTIVEVFANRVARFGDRLAVEKKRNGCWQGVSWRQYWSAARAVGLGFHHLGVRPGDRVALLAENCLEWLFTDMGTLAIGGCVVTVYPTLTADEIAYIVADAGARILVVEDNHQLQKVLAVREKCPLLEKIVVIFPQDADLPARDVEAFADLTNRGREEHQRDRQAFHRLTAEVEPADLATLVYTSGTTGAPKGVVINHGNIMAVIHALDRIRPAYADESDQTVPFLPLSHVFERAAGHFFGMYRGITASYADDINSLLQDFKEKRPTMILAVPRVCEKVYQKICMQVERQPAWRQRIFYWGQSVGARVSTCREAKRPVPLALGLQFHLAYRLIFRKLRQALGGRVRWMTASGAPTAREIILFFNAAGIMVVEGYGMTECFAPATMSNLADYRIGTVGRPLPGVDIKLAADGEILIKGPNVFQGYWGLEEQTREAFTPDGYFKSGDIGAFDADGFLTITDRKKNLIITSGGKNIAPQKIENLFLSDPLFAQFLVIGERRKFLSALVTINLDVARQRARAHGIEVRDPQALFSDRTFLDIVDAHVQAKNLQLARFETIKRYRIVPREFSQEKGELTPSLKLRRRKIEANFNALIEDMYRES